MERNEAIGVVRSFIDKLAPEHKEALSSLLPELAESEDEKMRNWIISVVMTDKELTDDQKERMKAYLEKQKEKKPAEWSEEDKNRFRNLIYLVERSNEGKGTKEGFVKFINRLKFLRPQPHWKPSDEQMKALLSKLPVIRGNGDKVQDLLESLYDDLKKLM